MFDANTDLENMVKTLAKFSTLVIILTVSSSFISPVHSRFEKKQGNFPSPSLDHRMVRIEIPVGQIPALLLDTSFHSSAENRYQITAYSEQFIQKLFKDDKSIDEKLTLVPTSKRWKFAKNYWSWYLKELDQMFSGKDLKVYTAATVPRLRRLSWAEEWINQNLEENYRSDKKFAEMMLLDAQIINMISRVPELLEPEKLYNNNEMENLDKSANSGVSYIFHIDQRLLPVTSCYVWHLRELKVILGEVENTASLNERH